MLSFIRGNSGIGEKDCSKPTHRIEGKTQGKRLRRTFEAFGLVVAVVVAVSVRGATASHCPSVAKQDVTIVWQFCLRPFLILLGPKL